MTLLYQFSLVLSSLLLPFVAAKSLPPGFVKEFVVNRPAVTGLWVSIRKRSIQVRVEAVALQYVPCRGGSLSAYFFFFVFNVCAFCCLPKIFLWIGKKPKAKWKTYADYCI